MPPPMQRIIEDIPQDEVGGKVTAWMATVPLPPTKITVEKQPDGKYTLTVDIP